MFIWPEIFYAFEFAILIFKLNTSRFKYLIMSMFTKGLYRGAEIGL